MTLQISAPTSIHNPIYRVEMGSDIVHISGDRSRDAVQSVPEDLLQRLQGDIIEIDRPRKWDLHEILSSQGRLLPPTLRDLAQDEKFWLIEINISFVPAQEHAIKWARFVTHLSTPSSLEQPEAYDLYPREIYDQTEQNKKVGVDLDFKFAAVVEGNLGNYLAEIKYTRQEPQVIATFGERRCFPTWDFSATRSSDVLGCKPLYLIVRMPQLVMSLDVEFGLFIKTQVKWGLFGLTKKKILSGSEKITI